MRPDRLKMRAHPAMQDARMVLGLYGWMNGGDVSTGTIETLLRRLDAHVLAEIDSEDFYILSFPGSMEVSSLLRPHAKIEEGLITDFQGPANTFFYSEPDNLILLLGREPNFKWSEYGECVFSLAKAFDVRRIYFVGSVAGVVPHTREPRLFCSVSDEGLKDEMQQYGVRFSNYEGPASIITYLTRLSRDRAVSMVSLVAEIPAYVHGFNPLCIESVTRRLAAILGLQIGLDDLRERSEAFETKLNEVVQDRPELIELIQKLEADYDNEVFDTQMPDLKQWLQQQGIRLE